MKKAGNVFFFFFFVIWDRVDYMERPEQLSNADVYWKVNFKVKIIIDLLGATNHLFKT